MLRQQDLFWNSFTETLKSHASCLISSQWDEVGLPSRLHVLMFEHIGNVSSKGLSEYIYELNCMVLDIEQWQRVASLAREIIDQDI